ncbi:MAG: hypothetical protein AB7H03_12575 [Nitrospirales bacterium]
MTQQNSDSLVFEIPSIASQFTRSLSASLAWWHGRAVEPVPAKRRTVLEPFGFAQDRLREFASVRYNFAATPVGWPWGGTLLSANGPCLIGASWTVLLKIGIPPS